MSDALGEAVHEQLAGVSRRVGADAYSHEVAEVRAAQKALETLREPLGLSTFVRSLNVHRGKPQLLLVFDRAGGERVVLKMYGRQRPNESVVQGAWAEHGVATVPVLARGDDPVSWLLMPFVDGHAVDVPPPGSVAARDLTARMAAELGRGHAVDVPVADRSALSERLRLHYGATQGSLIRHGYQPPDDWWNLVAAQFDATPTALLHGDPAPANMLWNSGGPHIFDTCGYLGPAEFDAARWCARVGGWSHAEELMEVWLGVETAADPARAHRLLGCELLMEAGVREIRKDEAGEPWAERDPWTEAALDLGVALLRSGRVSRS